jgi:hypothetical protein
MKLNRSVFAGAAAVARWPRWPPPRPGLSDVYLVCGRACRAGRARLAPPMRRPYYVHPQPVYVQPQPVYVQPQVQYYTPGYYVRPAPVYPSRLLPGALPAPRGHWPLEARARAPPWPWGITVGRLPPQP